MFTLPKTQSTGSEKNNKKFRVANLITGQQELSIQDYQKLWTVVLQRTDQFKVYFSIESNIFNFLWAKHCKLVGSVVKSGNVGEIWLQQPYSHEIARKIDFPVSDGPKYEIRAQFFVEITLFMALVGVESIRDHSTETHRAADLSQVFETRNLQSPRKTKKINKRTK